MDSASSASRAWSKVRRGWRAFGWIRSGGISRRPSSTLSLRGRIAARPLPIPRCCSATSGHLLGQLQVSRAARAVRSVPEHRKTEARRLPEADVARDDGVEDQRRKVLADLALDVAREPRAPVVHREDQPEDGEPRVELALDQRE